MARTPISAPESPRAYPLLWGGTASANLADGVVLAVAPLLAATLTREPALVSGLVVAQRLPWFLFVLFAGVIVDRVDRRQLLVAGNALRFVAIGGVVVGLVVGVRELWMLYLAAFLLGMAETIVDNASLAILPQLARPDRLTDANGRLFATQSILNELAGPPLGGLIFALSAVAAFATGSAAYLFAAVVYAMLPRRVPAAGSPATPAAAPPVRQALAEGLRWFFGSRLLLLLSSIAATINFFTAGTTAVLVLIAQDRLGLTDIGYGLLLAAGAIGGIPAGLVGPAIVRRIGGPAVVFLSTLAAGLAYVAAALSTSALVVGAVFVVAAFGFTLGNIVVITLRQTAVPNELLGRVTSVYRLVALGVMPLGALTGGLLATAFGLTAPFWAAGVGLVMLALVVAPALRGLSRGGGAGAGFVTRPPRR